MCRTPAPDPPLEGRRTAQRLSLLTVSTVGRPFLSGPKLCVDYGRGEYQSLRVTRDVSGLLAARRLTTHVKEPVRDSGVPRLAPHRGIAGAERSSSTEFRCAGTVGES